MEFPDTENLVPFGRYFLGQRIASGGMGEVYLAKMKGAAGFEKRVVIKKILPQLSSDPDFVERFIEEGKLVVKLTHANIVPVLDLGEVGGEYFIAMERVDGVDLRQLLRTLAATGEIVPLHLTLFVLSEVAKGLAYAHARVDDDGVPLNVIHRDISPSNIMVSRDGAVRILDFGIAKASDRLTHSVTGNLQGKFQYMSPEQASGKKVDHRSDIFSLGTVAYEVLCGTRPFSGHSDLETLELVRRGTPTPIAELRPDLPAPVVSIVERCMARRREDRYPNADAVARALQEFLFVQSSSPPGEKELGAFVRTHEGERAPAPPSRPRSLDDLLAEELLRADSPGVEEHTATREAPIPGVGSPPAETLSALGTPAPPLTQTHTATQTAATGSNRILVGGLVAIIAVLLFFNIQNLLDQDSATDPQPPVAPPAMTVGVAPGDADANGAPAVPTPTDEDVRMAPDAAATPGDAAATPDVRDAGPQTDVQRAEADAVRPVDPVPAPTPRFVALSGVPDGATVSVNDTPVQPDARGRVALPATGAATVRVSQPGHRTFVHEVADGPLGTSTLEVSLRPERKTIAVRTRPSGATLTVDGRKLGAAPRRVTVPSGRSVRVRATKPGYEPKEITLRHGSPAAVTLTLKDARMGRVSFRVFPANAQVLIDGRRAKIGSGNRVDRKLRVGEHVLVIRGAEGGKSKRVEFEIKEGATNRLGTFTLSGAP